jgi:hypothetical protein
VACSADAEMARAADTFIVVVFSLGVSWDVFFGFPWTAGWP